MAVNLVSRNDERRRRSERGSDPDTTEDVGVQEKGPAQCGDHRLYGATSKHSSSGATTVKATGNARDEEEAQPQREEEYTAGSGANAVVSISAGSTSYPDAD